MKQQTKLSIIFLLLLSFQLKAQHNPGKFWEMYTSPEEAGWSSAKLAESQKLYDSLNLASLMVIQDGKVVLAWGQYDRRYIIHSCRKSFISATYGYHIGQGNIDIDKTIGELNIDTELPLTEQEKTATIRDLLKARSGVYHPAAAETPYMAESRPERDSHKPDEFWYYNNWDFNALATILKQETGEEYFESFNKHIGKPLQMEEFRVSDGFYSTQNGTYSKNPAYVTKMSARDMARFGLLYLNNGKWNGEQIVPESWVADSQKAFSTNTGGYSSMGGYSYLWWIAQDEFKEYGMYEGAGAGGHYVSVLPKAGLVIVQRIDTYIGNRVRNSDRRRLYKSLLEAKTGTAKANPELKELGNTDHLTGYGPLQNKDIKKYTGNYSFEFGTVEVKKEGKDLMVQLPGNFAYSMLVNQSGSFILQDIELPVKFDLDENGNVSGIRLGTPETQEFAGTKEG